MSDRSKDATVVKIDSVLPHPNADRLEIVPIPNTGYQVVAGKGNFKPGDLAIYIIPDSIVPQKDEYSFVWEKDGGGNPRNISKDKEVPEKYRRITVRRLRKEYSEGLLMPIETAFGFSRPDVDFFKEGDDVAEFLGITHWNPPEDTDIENDPIRSVKQSKIWPRSIKGWFYFLTYWCSLTLYNPWGNLGGQNEAAPLNTPPIYDVESYKHHPNALELSPDEHIVVTEKIHGSNARFTYEPASWPNKGKLYAGSRKLWKRQGNSIWRQALKNNPDIELFCESHPGYTLYGEVVPAQKGFDYGVAPDSTEVFLFDIRTPDGEWVPYLEARRMTETFDLLKWTPCLFQGRPQSEQDILKLVDGQTLTAGKHIREGIVIKVQPEKQVRGLGRAQVKIISNEYYNQTKE